MSKILANQIANYGDNSPIEVKEGVNIPAGKPLQVAGNDGTSGQVLSSTGSALQWVTPFDGSYNSLTDKPTIPAAQIQSDWNATGGSVAAILNKPVVPAQPSVQVENSSGSGNLSYNALNGLFTFTPPDLSSFADGTNVANWNAAYNWGDHAQAGYAATVNSANWDLAYGWGDHAQAGYLTAEVDTLQTVLSRGATTSEQIIANGGIRADYCGVGGGIGGGDVQLQHNDSTHRSTLYHYNTLGRLEIKSVNNIDIIPGTTEGGGVSIFHDPDGSTETVRIQTTNTGVDISGNLDITGTVSGIDIEDLDNVNIAGGLQDQQVLKWEASSSSWKPANDLVGGASGIAFNDLSVVANSVGTASLSYNNTNGVFTYTPPDLSSYLTTETDPVFSAHVASGILQTNINNWTAAYNWGDHSTAGYLTAESDTLAAVTGRGNETTSGITLSTSNLILDSANDQRVQYNISGTETSKIIFRNTGALDFYSTNGMAFYATSNASPNNRRLQLLTVGGVRLEWQNSSRLETSATGVSITGDLALGSGDLTTTGKLYYSNNFADLTALNAVSATTYHGMFAHVHAEGHGYFGHAGGWTQLLDTGSSIGELADVDLTTSPSANDVLAWDGSNWAPSASAGGGGGANVTISDTAPGGASAGDLWWESDKGRLKIYYNDTDSTQWVDASPPLTNQNVPLYVGELELYNFGTQVQWVGNNGVTVSLRTAEGGGGFQSDYIRITFPTSFSSVNDYTVQATVYDAGTVGHVYGHAIRRTNPQYFDMLIYNLTSSANAQQASVAIAVYAI